VVHECQDLHGRESEAGGHDEEEQRNEHPEESGTRFGQHDDGEGSEGLHRSGRREDPLWADRAHQPRRYLHADHDADRVDAEKHAVLLRAELIQLLEQEGRTRQVREQAGEAHATDECDTHEDPVGENRPVPVADGGVSRTLATLRWKRFNDEDRDGDDDEDAVQGKEEKQPTPVEEEQQLRADHRGEDRSQTIDERQA
jgi:hypothetical protein